MTEPEDLAWRIEKPAGERRAEVIPPPGTTLSLVFYLRFFGHHFLAFWAKPEPRPRVPVSAWLLMAFLGIAAVLGWPKDREPPTVSRPSRAAPLPILTSPPTPPKEGQRFQVVCTVGVPIRELGLGRGGGRIQRVKREEAIRQVRSGAWSLFVQPPGLRAAEVTVSRAGMRIQTEPDDVKENNLSSLPQCR
jgi:Protein of unknown function (DUF3892)